MPGAETRRAVLLVSLWLEGGGSERQMAEVAKGLDRSRFEPHVGCLRLQGMRADELRSAGVPMVEFPMRGFLRWSHFRAAAALRRYVQRHRISIVHAFDVPGTLFSVIPARLSGVPLVLASQRALRDLTPRHRPFLRLTDRFAHGIVVNSQAVARDMMERDGVEAGRIHLCYNGLDTGVFHPPEEPRPESRDPVIGVVAVLRPEKSIQTLIQAFAQLIETSPGARLVIVGSGPMEGSLMELAARLGVAGSCRFEPASRDVAGWLRGFDIFVLPSLSEAMSNALLEAMACGCCAVASRVGGNPEAVEDGVTGLLFKPGDAAELASRLRLLAGDGALRRRLASAGVERVRERFALAASIRRMEQIYDTLYEKHGHRG